MPTAGERLATIEIRLEELTTDVREIRDLINGGGGVAWDRSVRGRLHALRDDVNALLMLRRAGVRLVSRGWRVVAAVCLILTAAAPYVLYFASR